MIKIRRGLHLPITGEPKPVIQAAPKVRQVAILGPDYHGMKPTMAVKEGDKVKCGQRLFSDKKTDGVHYTAPASGTVSAINRGERRVLQSVVIDVEGDDYIEFEKFDAASLGSLERETIVNILTQSGQWTAFRTRPYSKVPQPDTLPNSIFVTAIDTNPLSADPALIIKENADAFEQGVTLLTRLTDGNVFVCKSDQAQISTPNHPKVVVESFAGKHPAGNAGTHIHFLDPVSMNKTVWTIGYQDVIAMAKLLTTGRLFTDRVIALAGPVVKEPKLLKTQLGANTDELTTGQITDEHGRVISGSVFGGRTAKGAFAFLGRYHNQLSVLKEGNDRPMLHYLRPGFNYFSSINIYISDRKSVV